MLCYFFPKKNKRYCVTFDITNVEYLYEYFISIVSEYLIEVLKKIRYEVCKGHFTGRIRSPLI